MNSIDLSPLYRNSIGFDRLAALLDSAFSMDAGTVPYPPYNIEVLDQQRYAIGLAVAGFAPDELSINVESGVLSVCGKKEHEAQHQYTHHGIANRTFERKFDLADYVEVTGAKLDNGLLTISLVKEVPEALKARTIAIQTSDTPSSAVLEHESAAKPERATRDSKLA
jgi:molecular chaperone IbpA